MEQAWRPSLPSGAGPRKMNEVSGSLDPWPQAAVTARGLRRLGPEGFSVEVAGAGCSTGLTGPPICICLCPELGA